MSVSSRFHLNSGARIKINIFLTCFYRVFNLTSTVSRHITRFARHALSIYTDSAASARPLLVVLIAMGRFRWPFCIIIGGNICIRHGGQRFYEYSFKTSAATGAM